MSATRSIFDPKRVSDTKLYGFDFNPYLAAGETISSPVVTASVWSGVDASPSSIISGGASTSGGFANQKFTAGVSGVIYIVKCTATTSISAQSVSVLALLAVIPDGI